MIRLLVLIVICGLFYFSEGKPCPEKTQPHKTRCDVYYKCATLQSKTHVWIPEKCEEGLIYEPNLRICVLPGDDWECNKGELMGIDSDDENIVFGSGVEVLSSSFDQGSNSVKKESANESVESEENDDEYNESEYITVDNESDWSERDLESSGDGGDYIMVDTLSPERKTSEDGVMDIPEATSPTKIDPNLTAHLQRLTQLIDGLKQTYQNKETAVSDLRPDQLNAFLAHYNIKAQLNSIDPELEDTTSKINQDQRNQSKELDSSTTPSSQLEPETKLVLTNHLPDIYNTARPGDGYSNSQIVVNKPEGSVLFTLGKQPQDNVIDHRYDPKISEETLKTVLELSKQMLDNQDVRRVIPSSAYYPQVVQPIYLPPPVPQYANSIFNQHDGYEDKNYDKVSSAYYVPQSQQQKPGTTIIHNNLHLSPSSDEKNDQVDSYGQKLHTYPPLPSYQYFSEGSAEVQDHSVGNRYENNQLVTIRPSKGYDNYHNQPTYHSTTTSKPYISDSGSTLTDYYTPSPHLDETNVNNVFQMDRYPTINYGSFTGRPTHTHPTKSQKRPDISQKNQYYQNSYPSNYYPNQQSILQLFPSHIDPSKVKIRPNSQKLESMEQEASDDTNDQQDEDDQSVGTVYGTNDNDDSQSETYNRYNANKKITASQLAQYVEQLSGNVPQDYSNNNPSSSSYQYQQSEDESQFGSYNGNLLTYDLFNRKLVPTISYDSSKPDPSNCPVGVRQPNSTDCTRYYVCSKEDGRVMEYMCPSYTAFNPQTRICDAQFYALCHPPAVLSRYTVSENRRIQLEALKALQNAKRIRDQALRAQNIALRLRLGEADRNDKPSTPSPQPSAQYSSEVLSNFLQNAIDSNSLHSTGNGDGSHKVQSQSNTASQRPTNMYGNSATSSVPTKKRKYYCKEGDKVADQTSIYNYFVCYKNPQGIMKGHKMTCSTSLIFCPVTSMCTLARKCSSERS